MSEMSEQFYQASFDNFSISTSSPELEDSHLASPGLAFQPPFALLPGDSHVKISLRLEEEEALKESEAASGEKWLELLAIYNPSTCSWRTSQRCLGGEWAEFSETFPRAGTMRSGSVFQQEPLVRLTDVTGSSSWPTPLASDGTIGSILSPKDTVTITEGKIKITRPNGRKRGVSLSNAVRIREEEENQRRWPTPVARDYRAAGSKDSYIRNRSNGRQRSLNEEVVHGPYGQTGGQLNPMWVEWLQGYPIGWTALGS